MHAVQPTAAANVTTLPRPLPRLGLKPGGLCAAHPRPVLPNLLLAFLHVGHRLLGTVLHWATHTPDQILAHSALSCVLGPLLQDFRNIILQNNFRHICGLRAPKRPFPKTPLCIQQASTTTHGTQGACPCGSNQQAAPRPQGQQHCGWHVDPPAWDPVCASSPPRPTKVGAAETDLIPTLEYQLPPLLICVKPLPLLRRSRTVPRTLQLLLHAPRKLLSSRQQSGLAAQGTRQHKDGAHNPA